MVHHNTRVSSPTEVPSTPAQSVPIKAASATSAHCPVDIVANWHLVLPNLTSGLLLFGAKSMDGMTRFLAYQALFAALAALAGHGLLTMLGGAFEGALRLVWDGASFGLWAFQVYRAAQGRPVTLPILGALARRQAAGDPADRDVNQTLQ